MPIYAYKCSNCGFAKDVLQKMSDAPLAVCPSCGQASFSKQLTAAGFQLKGSGWYVTDFRDGGSGKAKPADAAKGEGDGKADAGDKAAGKDAAATPAAGGDSAAAPGAAPAPAAAPASAPATAAAPAPAAKPAAKAD